MYLPKKDVFTALNSISNVTVRQASQKTEAVIPSITFFIADNSVELDLSNEISRQDILVTVDIWASNSSKADTLLSKVETKMRGLGYRLSFVMDVSDPQNIAHVTTRFTGIK